MSWKVESLLLNRAAIRSDYGPGDDVWEELVFLEDKIKRLKEAGRLTDFEVEVLDKVIFYGSLNEAGRDMGMIGKTVARYFHNACYRIGFYLGSTYTDEGTITEMTEKYNLTPEQIEKMREFISGRYKHRVMRGKDESIE